jgi:hypothetical protein
MSRRRTVKVVIVLIVALTLFTSIAPAFAHEGDTPTPPSTPTISTPAASTEEVIPPSSFPPLLPGVSEGNRVYVRTSAISPTEYLLIRNAIVDLGFKDVLEVAPGSLIVDVGSLSVEEASTRLKTIEKISEVTAAPKYQGSPASRPASYPSWWWYLPALLVLALVATSRRFTKLTGAESNKSTPEQS